MNCSDPSASSYDSHRRAEQARVLVVDDDPDYTMLVEEALEDSGRFKVVVAGTAQQARELAFGDFSVIVLDHNLPDATGIELLPEITRECEVPVVMLTGENVVDTAVQSLQAGGSVAAQRLDLSGSITIIPHLSKTTEDTNEVT